jgi:hypothetical protein
VKTRILTCILAVACVAPAAAQDPPPAPPVRVGMRVGDVVSGYDSGGRRDPFVSLIVTRRPNAATPAEGGPRRTGLGALALADTRIRGIVRHGAQMLAIAEGPDNQSFVLHVADRLLDAEVKAIDAQGVVFKERQEGALGGTPREVRKALRPAAEGIR